jgi:adenylosuccinate lyase
MTLNELTAISPVDGRYRDKVKELDQYFSEYGLIAYRVKVELMYFIALCEIPLNELKHVTTAQLDKLKQLYQKFSVEDAQRIKEIESTTNHDVKAVEYFIKERFDEIGLTDVKEFVHFALTSQDINNTATPLSIKDALNNVYFTLMGELSQKLKDLTTEWANIPMLAHTHGQPASPTKLGKELYVFLERMENQLEALSSVPISAKFGGATGNFNAHAFAYPDIDWVVFSNRFVNQLLGLNRLQTTTQIDHYDNVAAFFDGIKRINTVLIDLCRDMWTYISMEYFKQKIGKNEVGSSTMPHKVNPIDFENAEGNFGIANSICEHLAAKLPVSRLQRDLTDSTVLRNIGVPMAHTLLAVKSLLKGLNKLIVNTDAINRDLENNWSVLAEPIQTVLRKTGYPKPYEALKELTRTNKAITKESLHNFIDGLDIESTIKQRLKELSPFNYTGLDLI